MRRGLDRCFRSLLPLLFVLLTAVPGRAGTLHEWLDGIRVEVRMGGAMISNYDVAVNIAFDRMLRGLALGDGPGEQTRREALSRLLYHTVLLDAVDRFNLGVPDLTQIQQRARSLVQLYGSGSTAAFAERTGMPYDRLVEEVRNQARIQKYLQEVVLPGIRVTDAEVDDYYARMTTAWGLPPGDAQARSHVRRLLFYRQIDAELQRLVDRYRERNSIEVMVTGLTVDELLQLWKPQEDSLNPMNLPVAP